MWAPHDPILLRSVFRGRVRFAFPHTFAGAEDGRIAFYIRPGTGGKLVPRDEHGRYMERWVAGVAPADHVWVERRVLWLARPGEAHSLGLLWHDATDRFLGWYVQLQKPLKRTSLGLDTTDHALDIEIDPGGAWRWKDEVDFADAQALGVFTPDEAATIRAEGERVLSAWPFPTGWENWRPDTGRELPQLPANWHVVSP